MLKILSTEQIRSADRATIEREPITSIDLMERAALACADWIAERYSIKRPVIIMAGVGNNGGDALVIARLLKERGYGVRVFVVRYSEKFSTDFQVNYDRLVRMGIEPTYILEESQFPAISSDAVVVDGIFGSGLSRPPQGLSATCIEQINASIADVVSIDIPSGLFADKPTASGTAIITASHTLSFEVPKLAFLVPGAEEFTGQWHLLPIGLDPSYINRVETKLFLVDHLREYAPMFIRRKFDHKGTFGHTLIVAGSYGKMGAALLSSKAALRAGSGLVTAYVPRCGNLVLQTAIPEVMCQCDDLDEFIGSAPDTSKYQVIAVGPGLGQSKKTRRMLKTLLQQATCPVVIDADALNILSESAESISWLPPGSILTPHMKEFERLTGPAKNPIHRLELLRDHAVKWKVFILLKGAHSALATPAGEIYFNQTGNPALATAGSGDVLTGIIAGILAQIHNPLAAAMCGMYLHGVTADLACQEKKYRTLIASDLLEALPQAMAQHLHIPS